jgi:predicted nucleic acid-binding protein
LNCAHLRRPATVPSLPSAASLGPGEIEVLALVLESTDAIALLEDGVARKVAQTFGGRFTGTLGLLIDARRTGLVPAVDPLLYQLQALGFRLGAATGKAVLRLAGEGA